MYIFKAIDLKKTFIKKILSYIRNDSCIKKIGRAQFKKKQLNISYKTMAE